MNAPRTSESKVSGPTIWGRLLGMIARGSQRVGVDSERLLRALDVEPTVIEDPDGRVPLDVLYRGIELVLEWSDDELAMLVLASEIDPSSLDALGFLALTSPTLGAALDATIRYQRVFAEGERYALEPEGDRTVVRYEPWGPPRAAHAAWADAFARDVGVNIPRLVAAPLDGVEIALRRAPPRDRERYAELLGLMPTFGAACDEVRVPNAILAMSTPRADPMLAGFFERYLDALLARLPSDSFVGRTVAAIEPLLPGGAVELDAVADRMRVSTRTLQRRLADAGSSFSDLVDRTRRAKALALIDAGVAISEIAWLMGYSEPSAFHRAFVRWTGMTPSAWRARATKRA